MNKVILLGRAGADPEVRDGTVKVATFSLATTYFKGEGQEGTEWHRIKVFGKMADTVERFVRKGHRVAIEGRVHTEKYNDKYFTDIIVERLEIVDFPPKTDEAYNGYVSDTINVTEEKPASDNWEDDIPF